MVQDIVIELEQPVYRLIGRLHDHPVVGRIMDGTADGAALMKFLKGSFDYVRWTQPLLSEGARALRRSGKYPDLEELYRTKSAEEDGHEQWLLEDVQAQGGDADAVRRAWPPPAVEAYVAWNRHHIAAGRPLCVLGAAYALETLGAYCAPRAVENLLARSRIRGIREGKGLRFLAGHAVADQGHITELTERLRRITDPDDRRSVVLSNHVTCQLYEGFFSGGGRRARGRAAPTAGAQGRERNGFG